MGTPKTKVRGFNSSALTAEVLSPFGKHESRKWITNSASSSITGSRRRKLGQPKKLSAQMNDLLPDSPYDHYPGSERSASAEPTGIRVVVSPEDESGGQIFAPVPPLPPHGEGVRSSTLSGAQGTRPDHGGASGSSKRHGEQHSMELYSPPRTGQHDALTASPSKEKKRRKRRRLEAGEDFGRSADETPHKRSRDERERRQRTHERQQQQQQQEEDLGDEDIIPSSLSTDLTEDVLVPATESEPMESQESVVIASPPSPSLSSSSSAKKKKKKKKRRSAEGNSVAEPSLDRPEIIADSQPLDTEDVGVAKALVFDNMSDNENEDSDARGASSIGESTLSDEPLGGVSSQPVAKAAQGSQAWKLKEGRRRKGGKKQEVSFESDSGSPDKSQKQASVTETDSPTLTSPPTKKRNKKKRKQASIDTGDDDECEAEHNSKRATPVVTYGSGSGLSRARRSALPVVKPSGSRHEQDAQHPSGLSSDDSEPLESDKDEMDTTVDESSAPEATSTPAPTTVPAPAPALKQKPTAKSKVAASSKAADAGSLSADDMDEDVVLPSSKSKASPTAARKRKPAPKAKQSAGSKTVNVGDASADSSDADLWLNSKATPTPAAKRKPAAARAKQAVGNKAASVGDLSADSDGAVLSPNSKATPTVAPKRKPSTRGRQAASSTADSECLSSGDEDVAIPSSKSKATPASTKRKPATRGKQAANGKAVNDGNLSSDSDNAVLSPNSKATSTPAPKRKPSTRGKQAASSKAVDTDHSSADEDDTVASPPSSKAAGAKTRATRRRGKSVGLPEIIPDGFTDSDNSDAQLPQSSPSKSTQKSSPASKPVSRRKSSRRAKVQKTFLGADSKLLTEIKSSLGEISPATPTSVTPVYDPHLSAGGRQWASNTQKSKMDFDVAGVPLRTGAWSVEEIRILESNIQDYLAEHPTSSVTDLVFNCEPFERKGFYMQAARGIRRPLNSVYTFMKRYHSPAVKTGRYTAAEEEHLLELYAQHGAKWTKIGRIMGRAPEPLCMKYRALLEKRQVEEEHGSVKRGHWDAEEHELLAVAVREVAGVPSGPVTVPVCWESVAGQMPGRTAVQCRRQWFTRLGMRGDTGAGAWSEAESTRLVQVLCQCEGILEDGEVPWERLRDEHWPDVPIPVLRQAWAEVRRQVPDYLNKSFTEIMMELVT